MTPSSIVLLSLGLLISKFDCKLKDNTFGIQMQLLLHAD